jgi:hypothetical protein
MRLVLSLSASIPLTGSEAAAHKRREKEKKGKLVRLGNWSEFLLVSRLGRSEIWASTGLDWAVLQHGPDPAMQKILLYSLARRRVRTSDLVVNSHTLWPTELFQLFCLCDDHILTRINIILALRQPAC